MTTLAVVMRGHARALEYDLMTRTGRTLGEYLAMGADGACALAAFVRYLPPDSMTYRDVHPRDELWAWSSTLKTNAILADLFDAYAAAHARKGRRPRPYPRPNAEERSIGRGAIPASQFMDWWTRG